MKLPGIFLLVSLTALLASCSSWKTVYREKIATDRSVIIFYKSFRDGRMIYSGDYTILVNKGSISLISMHMIKDKNCDTLYGNRKLVIPHPTKPGKTAREYLATAVSYDSTGAIPFMEEEQYLLRKMLAQREKDGDCSTSRLHSATSWRRLGDKEKILRNNK